MLVRQGGDGLDADHIPFELNPAAGPLGTLTAHVARANPLWQLCATGSPVMVVFRGAEAFISPSWYQSKHESHHQVPRWNYEVLHAHGKLTVHDDERFVRGLVARLTRHHEAVETKPWKMTDSAPEHIDGMARNHVVSGSLLESKIVPLIRLHGCRQPAHRKYSLPWRRNSLQSAS
jgi:transcriptional regulator